MARTFDNEMKHICDQCGKDMHPEPDERLGSYTPWPRPDKKYCSPKCKQRAYRDRIEAATEARRAEARAQQTKERNRRDLAKAKRKLAKAKKQRAGSRAKKSRYGFPRRKP